MEIAPTSTLQTTIKITLWFCFQKAFFFFLFLENTFEKKKTFKRITHKLQPCEKRDEPVRNDVNLHFHKKKVNHTNRYKEIGKHYCRFKKAPTFKKGWHINWQWWRYFWEGRGGQYNRPKQSPASALSYQLVPLFMPSMCVHSSHRHMLSVTCVRAWVCAFSLCWPQSVAAQVCQLCSTWPFIFHLPSRRLHRISPPRWQLQSKLLN